MWKHLSLRGHPRALRKPRSRRKVVPLGLMTVKATRASIFVSNISVGNMYKHGWGGGKPNKDKVKGKDAFFSVRVSGM